MKYGFHGGCIHSQSGAHGAYTVTGIIEKRNLLKRKHHVTVCMSNFWEGNVLSRLSLCHFVCSLGGGGPYDYTWICSRLFTPLEDHHALLVQSPTAPPTTWTCSNS